MELFEELLDAGKLKSVIHRCNPLSETPYAFRYSVKGTAGEESLSLCEVAIDYWLRGLVNLAYH